MMNRTYYSWQTDTQWYNFSKDNKVVSGFEWKSGPGHAWIVLSGSRLAQMRRNHPELVLDKTCSGFISNYEEDCEVALVGLAFWQQLSESFNIENCIKTVAYWYPVSFNEWIQKCIETGEIEGVLKAVGDCEIRWHDSEIEPCPFIAWVEIIREYCVEREYLYKAGA